MADGVFVKALGAARRYAENHGAAFQVVLLKEAEADGTLENHDTVDALLAAAGNTEADFTNYARKTGLAVTINEDETNARVDLDLPDQTWVDAGGATDNTLVKALICVQTGADDTTLVPLTHQDFSVSTDGSDLTLEFAADGFYRAS